MIILVFDSKTCVHDKLIDVVYHVCLMINSTCAHNQVCLCGACLECHECLLTQVHTTDPYATKKIHTTFYTFTHVKCVHAQVCTHMCKVKLICTIAKINKNIIDLQLIVSYSYKYTITNELCIILLYNTF